MRPELRDIIKKFPKLRGYRFSSTVQKHAPVNVGDLDATFSAKTEVTPALLVEHKLVRRRDGRIPKVKVLGTGEISKALIIKGCTVSEVAKAKIEKAGGSIVA